MVMADADTIAAYRQMQISHLAPFQRYSTFSAEKSDPTPMSFNSNAALCTYIAR